VATSSATFFRQMGGTLGTAVFLSILFSALPGRIVASFRAAAADPAFTAALRDPAVLADPANRPVLAALQGGAAPNLDDSSFLKAVDPVLARPILEGFASSMSTVFLCAATVLVIGLGAVLKMKEVPLRAQSGVEAQRSAEADASGTLPSAALQAAVATTVPVPADAEPARDAVRAEPPRPWRRTRPVGGDGARAVARGTGAVGEPLLETGGEHNGHVDPVVTARNGTGRNGSGHHGDVPGGDGAPRATVLPAAPSGLAAEDAAAAGAAVPTGDASGGRAPSPADPRDRLLAMLLPDAARAVALVAEAERARDAGRRAQRELAAHRRELDRAVVELRAQGLTKAQVCRLLELTDD
jgi:hypothetical protein